jgi:hypothetical protein
MLVCGRTIGQEKEHFSKAIEDNSFLIEEAYNQEKGVVQHIWSGLYQPGSPGLVLLGFTDEWPLFSEAQQVSFSIPYTLARGGEPSGIGDIVLNYRYQLSGPEAWTTIAPRFSISIPTGNSKTGLGYGRPGFQINIPASKRVSEYIAFHLNAGANVTPNARTYSADGAEHVKTISSYALGASSILLLDENINAMIEGIYVSADAFTEAGGVERVNQFIINPGMRAAINLGELQIVPGFAVPVTFSGGETTTGWFLYLSFEHPF